MNNTPEFLKPRLLEEFSVSELREIGKQFSEALVRNPHATVQDVLADITENPRQLRRYKIGITIISRTLINDLGGVTPDHVEKVLVWGHIDEDGDPADVIVDVKFVK